MTESDDSDIDFQSADEGEEETEILELKQPDTIDHEETKPNQSTDKTDANTEEGIRNVDESNNDVEDGESENKDKIGKNVELRDDLTTDEQETSNNEVKPEESIEEAPLSAEIEQTCIQEESVTVNNSEQSAELSVAPSDQIIGRQVDSQVDLSVNSQVAVNPAGGDSERSNLQSPLDRLSEKSSKTSGGWGWGSWGKSMFSSATSTVSGLGHGLSSAIQSVESSLGVPQPKEIALEEKTDVESDVNGGNENTTNEEKEKEEISTVEEKNIEENGEEGDVGADKNFAEEPNSGYGIFSFGASAITGMVSGGLGALEMIGKKTMDVIQDGDPGLRKKREYFTKSNLPSLSQTLKEAAEAAEKTALKEEEEDEKNRAHYGILFDKYQGLSHLEALEILSNQSEGKVHSVMATVTGDQLEKLKTQMIEIKDAFQLQDMDVEEEEYETATFVDTITEHLFILSVAATPDKLKRVQREAHEWLAKCKQELETLKQEKEIGINLSKDANKEEDITIVRDVADNKNIQGNTADDKKVTDGSADDKKQTENDVADDKHIQADTADNKKATDGSADDKKQTKNEVTDDKTNMKYDTANDKLDIDVLADDRKDAPCKEADNKDHKNQEESEEKSKPMRYLVPKEIHVKTIQTLAELTSRCIEQFHKAAELMLLHQAKEHSKNPIQIAASLSKLTSVLCCEVSSLTSSFCEQLTVAADVMGEEDDVNPFITNSYLEGSNSMSYIQDAFQLLLPVLQVVAIEYEE
ncbi:protein FAM114A2-like isoform X2 [Anneissia japonica]|uniref:protein FAM114A2-like isoform X1 n=1 Tax=Anneissia japonica TaxID=1529436 RepID=UPI0014257B71|nr:protein FAM114A2-like isoform X1 [Anneissia japonica]XP_033106890.1 protein FAM114A2-like isoform X2 [Anneissia japonica]